MGSEGMRRMVDADSTVMKGMFPAWPYAVFMTCSESRT